MRVSHGYNIMRVSHGYNKMRVSHGYNKMRVSHGYNIMRVSHGFNIMRVSNHKYRGRHSERRLWLMQCAATPERVWGEMGRWMGTHLGFCHELKAQMPPPKRHILTYLQAQIVLKRAKRGWYCMHNVIMLIESDWIHVWRWLLYPIHCWGRCLERDS